MEVEDASVARNRRLGILINALGRHDAAKRCRSPSSGTPVWTVKSLLSATDNDAGPYRARGLGATTVVQRSLWPITRMAQAVTTGREMAKVDGVRGRTASQMGRT